ncbi:MAG TPA: sigma-54 dependent transcriptional regulator [Tepidisphaeraceae bacterium]|nr:sigma-54 dependent transcriptional regulator [Tepidisphaeraceae bacterium]
MTNQSPAQSLNILVVDDEVNIRKTLAIGLEVDGHSTTAVGNARDAVAEAANQPFDLAFVDLRLGADLGSDLIPQLLAQSPWMRIVIITAHGSIDNAVETMKRGAADYLTKPFTPVQVKLVVERVARLRALEQQVAGLEEIVGQSSGEINLQSTDPAMQRMLNLARQVAPSDTTVLIRGESGTGKSVLARAIHGWSNRANKPMATISCPTLSAQLLESELFGHAKGAFTGAIRDNAGRIASSDGGTLLLDEIGDLPLPLQPKLLRFLQDREYERVGESRTRRADVRVIAATHVDLEAAVAAGTFREDLLYRVKVIQLDLPPLRDRPDDVAGFAERFLAELRRGRSIIGFTGEAMAALRSYRWPGNIRELHNVIERALLLCQTDQVGIEHLPAEVAGGRPAPPGVGDPVSLDQLEEMHIRRVLARSKSLDEAAKTLGIDVATLWRKRRKYGL